MRVVTSPIEQERWFKSPHAGEVNFSIRLRLPRHPSALRHTIMMESEGSWRTFLVVACIVQTEGLVSDGARIPDIKRELETWACGFAREWSTF